MKPYFAGVVSNGVVDFEREIGRRARYLYLYAVVDSRVRLESRSYMEIVIGVDEELEVEEEEGVSRLFVNGEVEVLAK